MTIKLDVLVMTIKTAHVNGETEDRMRHVTFLTLSE